MRTFYKALILVSALALPLGLGSCNKRDKDEPYPSVLIPTETTMLSSDEASVNTRSIAVLRDATERKLSVKQVSTFTSGSGGYNILLSDERLVQVYTGKVAGSLRQSVAGNTTPNPISSINLNQRGSITMTIVNSPALQLRRSEERAVGALSAEESIAPESKFLLTSIMFDAKRVLETHSRVRRLELTEFYDRLYNLDFDRRGYCTNIEYILEDRQGNYRDTRDKYTNLSWSGERITEASYKTYKPNGVSTGPYTVYTRFVYEPGEQKISKIIHSDLWTTETMVTYQPTNRTVTTLSAESKIVYSYNEYYQLTKVEHYKKDANDQWVATQNEIYSYNQQGDIEEYILTLTTGDEPIPYEQYYDYKYDERGNWIVRWESFRTTRLTHIRRQEYTRKIFY